MMFQNTQWANVACLPNPLVLHKFELVENTQMDELA